MVTIGPTNWPNRSMLPSIIRDHVSLRSKIKAVGAIVRIVHPCAYEEHVRIRHGKLAS